ncbi:MAG: class I SAM-dependent methyltransferase [Hyphomicrobiaceae bacterium]
MSSQRMPPHVAIETVATEANFDPASYLRANPDVAAAVARGSIESAAHHFTLFGRDEGRRLRDPSGIAPLRAAKLERLRPHLRTDMPSRDHNGRLDYLSDDLRRETGIADTANVSSNNYDAYAQALISKHADGLILDAGAGQRRIYYGNVVNFEIVPYDSTDIVGVGESLPFLDGTFDAVFSIAVLEHVRDPFRCARELIRVLKPGGDLLCSVPFLQPLHGYPHHYYNMSHQGLRALFERDLVISDHLVIDSILPVWSLTWFVQSWASGLRGRTREDFLDMPLRDLLADPRALLERPWVRQLPVEKNFELASATLLLARKPA